MKLFPCLRVIYTRESASQLIHNDSNLVLVSNENIFLFTPQCQVIAKIIMHNIVPKSGELNRARGCIPLIFYIFQSLPVNIPRMIFDQMTSPSVASKFQNVIDLTFLALGHQSFKGYYHSSALLDRYFMNRKQSYFLKTTRVSPSDLPEQQDPSVT